MKKMRCLAIDETKTNIGWIEKDIPQIGDYDGLLKPIMLSPCTSDVHAMLNGKNPPGRVLGHEAIAEIVKIGCNVSYFKVGDIVAIPAVTPNYRSLECQDNLPQHSDKPLGGMTLSTFEDGTFAEFFKVRDIDLNAAYIPDGVSYEAALMTVDMVTTGFSGAEMAKIEFGDSVAVLGIGPVGLMAVAGAMLRGAGTIIGVGHRAKTRELAIEFGATGTVDYKEEDYMNKAIELNSGRLFDSAIVCGGYSDVLARALSIVKPNGTVVNLVGQNRKLEVEPSMSTLWCAHKTLTGGLCVGGRRRMERLFSIIASGRLQPEKMVTHRYKSFDNIEIALRAMIEPKSEDLVKAVVYCEELL